MSQYALEGGSQVVVWTCEDGHVHREEATHIDDKFGWLFFILAEPGDDGVKARMLPTERVVGVEFYGTVIPIDAPDSPAEIVAEDEPGSRILAQ